MMPPSKDRSTRPVPRRQVISIINDVVRRLRHAKAPWDIPMQVAEEYVGADGRRNHRWRAREESEKPENRADAWTFLAVGLEEAASTLTAAAQHAREQAQRLRSS